MNNQRIITLDELNSRVNKYVNTEFNYIQVSVLEKITEGTLFEFIRVPEVNEEHIQDVFNELTNYETLDLIKDYAYENHFDFAFKNDTVAYGFSQYVLGETEDVEEIEDVIFSLLPEGDVSGDSFIDFMKEKYKDEIQEKVYDSAQENYPMWSTCFEFRHEPSEETIKAAIDAGFGIIEGLEDFNTLLFVSGCGYSFYGAHWIPMYLDLPFNSDIKNLFDRKDYNYL